MNPKAAAPNLWCPCLEIELSQGYLIGGSYRCGGEAVASPIFVTMQGHRAALASNRRAFWDIA